MAHANAEKAGRRRRARIDVYDVILSVHEEVES
jgi:hypothetical protein